MRLEFIFFIGIMSNLLLAMVFPYQLLPTSDANALVGDDYQGYTFSDDTFGSDIKGSTSNLVTTIGNNQNTESLTESQSAEVSILDGVGGFFDGLFDGLNKIRIYFSLLLPFSAVLGLLPGAIGYVFSLLYQLIAVVAILIFIRRG